MINNFKRGPSLGRKRKLSKLAHDHAQRCAVPYTFADFVTTSEDDDWGDPTRPDSVDTLRINAMSSADLIRLSVYAYELFDDDALPADWPPALRTRIRDVRAKTADGKRSLNSGLSQLTEGAVNRALDEIFPPKDDWTGWQATICVIGLFALIGWGIYCIAK
jgi:hypothetical protein